MFEFILFLILGYCVFAWPPSPIPTNRVILLVIFVVLMLLWLVAGVAGFHVPTIDTLRR
jgi:hypothetical protein